MSTRDEAPSEPGEQAGERAQREDRVPGPAAQHVAQRPVRRCFAVCAPAPSP
jgi:hypothetical protein